MMPTVFKRFEILKLHKITLSLRWIRICIKFEETSSDVLKILCLQWRPPKSCQFILEFKCWCQCLYNHPPQIPSKHSWDIMFTRIAEADGKTTETIKPWISMSEGHEKTSIDSATRVLNIEKNCSLLRAQRTSTLTRELNWHLLQNIFTFASIFHGSSVVHQINSWVMHVLHVDNWI